MWCCSKGPQPPKQTTPKSKTNAIQRPSDAKPARNPHPSNPPQPAAAAGDQPPPDLSGYNNAPVQVHAQSSLMQSYALPAQPVDSVGYFPGVAVTVATGNGLPAPREHVFVAKTNDTYLHLQASPTSPTGWEPSELTGLRKISTWTAGFYDGNVLLFALTGQQAWKRTAEAKVGGMQSFATSEWVSLGEIPGTAAYPAISFADGQLWVSCTPNDYSSGRLFLLPWQTPGAPWDVMSTTPQPLWTCSASTSGCYVGGYDSSRNYQYIEFYPTDKSAPLSTAEGGAEGANKLMGSTLGRGCRVLPGQRRRAVAAGHDLEQRGPGGERGAGRRLLGGAAQRVDHERGGVLHSRVAGHDQPVDGDVRQRAAGGEACDGAAADGERREPRLRGVGVDVLVDVLHDVLWRGAEADGRDERRILQAHASDGAERACGRRAHGVVALRARQAR